MIHKRSEDIKKGYFQRFDIVHIAMQLPCLQMPTDTFDKLSCDKNVN